MSIDSFALLRKEMVLGQLLSRGIKDSKVLSVFRKIPREIFVPNSLKTCAYQDRPLSIGQGQTISQPYIVALMTELLDVKRGDTILEVGTGSGYQAAILLGLGAKVYGVERIMLFAVQAKERLKSLGFDFEVKTGDGTLGWDKFSPYDKIIISAASPKIPGPLLNQLKVGGKMVLPLGTKVSQQLTVIDKIKEGEFKSTGVCGCVFVPLVGKEGWSE